MADALTIDRTPLVAKGPDGRAYTGQRRIRWGDADRHRRLRLDAVARYLQDVANDDSRDVGLDHQAWVVRRTTIDVVVPPRPSEVIDVTTFCGGLGSRWAERRTTITGDHGGHVETAGLWIAVDPRTGRPNRLAPEFTEAYGAAASGRTVGASLHHGPPPDDAVHRPWPLRSTDYDALGHVNNAATWAPTEDEMERRGLVPVRAEIEYRAAIDPAATVDVAVAQDGDVLGVWVLEDGTIRASALVLTAPR